MDASATAAPPAARPRFVELALFAANFARHPHMLGSVIPSSRCLVDHVLDRVDWQHARVIVEYGPGVGTFTAQILRRMREDARLVVIETNADFVAFLRDAFPDPRLIVDHGSAEDVGATLAHAGLPRAHTIISGIPLGSFPRGLQAGIVEASREALLPDGRFLVYQFTARVLPVLRATFARVERSREWRNFPPAQLFDCAQAESET